MAKPNMLVTSFIDVEAWNAAGWVGTGFLTWNDAPPGVGLMFRDKDAARGIFEGLRQRLGPEDQYEELQLYERWWREISQRGRLAKGEFALPNIKLPPLTDEQRSEFREQWQARVAAARAELGYPADDDDVPPGLLDYFCLCNARMRIVTYEFIIVQTASVGAFFPGRLARQDGGGVG